MKYFVLTLALLGMLAFGMTSIGCEEQGPAEEAGEQLDEAGEDVREGVEDMGE